MSIAEPDFWDEEWQKAIDASPVQKRKFDSDTGKMDRWNKMAKDFAERTAREKPAARRQAVISDLCARGILNQDSTVLDIGAGPGAWTLPLSVCCRHITALEPADAMADILAARLGEEGIQNISIERSTWQSADLDSLDWHKAFDLVFASMTPGIDGPAALKKMMDACRGYCYYTAIAGDGWKSEFGQLWEKFFNEPMGKMANNIIYPFNLAYAMGFRPSLNFFRWGGENDMEHEEAIRHFTGFFKNYLDVTWEVEAAIKEYIDNHSKDGRYVRPDDIWLGTMVWPVNPKQSQNIV